LVRRTRVEYPGAIYHVIQRGNNGESVFDGPEERNYLTELLCSSVKTDGVELFAYVIMSNHYHLALRTGIEPLSKVMHRINTGYSMYYNRKMKRTGHVFQGRYKAIPVHEENYIISSVRYIHRNPVKAGICEHVSKYPWSSDLCYRKTEPGFIEIGLLMDMLSADRNRSFEKYCQLMDQEDDLGNAEIKTAKNRVKEDRSQIKKSKRSRKPLDEILKETGVSQEELETIKKGSRVRKLTLIKTLYAKSAWEQGYSLKEIADHIGVSPVAVFKYINEK